MVLANSDGMESAVILKGCCETDLIPIASLSHVWVTMVGISSISTHHCSPPQVGPSDLAYGQMLNDGKFCIRST